MRTLRNNALKTMKGLSILTTLLLISMCTTNNSTVKDGNKYVPYDQRDGEEAVVYFTRNLSPEGLIAAYEKVSGDIEGRVGVKLHTGEQNGPNIIPREWVKALIEKDLPEATIIETNTYYEGDRYTTEAHRKTIQVNGWTFCPVDIIDEEDTLTLPVVGGKWFDKMSVGSHLVNYDSMVALTHFKGHTQGGFGGAQPVGHRRGGVHGADDRIHQGHHRPFRQARDLCQCDAQHVRLL